MSLESAIIHPWLWTADLDPFVSILTFDATLPISGKRKLPYLRKKVGHPLNGRARGVGPDTLLTRETFTEPG